MRIIYDPKFVSKVKEIREYIAKDSEVRAELFLSELQSHIEDIPVFPYKFRQSKWFKNENIRDLVFKGYTIPYWIQKDKIVVLDIFKWTDR